MLREPKSRNLYRGHAVALCGHIERPVPEIIQTQAAAAISISGGCDSARAECFTHRDIVSFKSARSHVSGRESSDGKYLETLATCVVEGLDILGVVTAERVVGRLVGSHVVGTKGANPVVTPSGSYFQGLRVFGKEVKCDLIGHRFDALESKPNAAVSLRTDDKVKNQVIQDEGWEAKGFLPISLWAAPPSVKDLPVNEDQSWNREQNAIVIPHFGRIYLAEMIICCDSHRLTMLRVELGCPAEGGFDVCSVDGEPHIMP